MKKNLTAEINYYRQFNTEHLKKLLRPGQLQLPENKEAVRVILEKRATTEARNK